MEAELVVSLQDQLSSMRDSRLCQVCLEREMGTVFCPCGHMICCEQCAQECVKCPICRAEVAYVQRVFFSWLMKQDNFLICDLDEDITFWRLDTVMLWLCGRFADCISLGCSIYHLYTIWETLPWSTESVSLFFSFFFLRHCVVLIRKCNHQVI